MEILKAIILGIIEGITEWLPISSTGHMILVDEFLKLDVSAAFKEMFFVVIQLGAIMAVVILFWKKLFPFKIREKKLMVSKNTVELWLKVIVACAPAAIIGIPFNDKIDELFYNYKVVALMLIIYGVLFIVVENVKKKANPLVTKFSALSYKTALLIGAFQVLALIPGTSRSGATILGAMILGCSRGLAAEFSFFLAIPVMFGASFVKLLKFGFNYTGMEVAILLIGMIVAFAVSVFAIKFLMSYIQKHDFKAFGWYRIALGVIVILFFML